jgi:hypothetical protein
VADLNLKDLLEEVPLAERLDHVARDFDPGDVHHHPGDVGVDHVVEDRLEVPAPAEERRVGVVGKPVRRFGFPERDLGVVVVGREVPFGDRQPVRLPFDRGDAAGPPGGLHGDRAGAGPDLDEVVCGGQRQFIQRDRPDLRLRRAGLRVVWQRYLGHHHHRLRRALKQLGLLLCKFTCIDSGVKTTMF